MRLITTTTALRTELATHRRDGKKIGLLPTMGAIHNGHISLALQLKEQSDITICSIFVNPTQFNDPKDYEQYTINLDEDLSLLSASGIDIVFAPSVAEIYPSGFQTSISVSKLAASYEGTLRPGHFDGVATVVTILLNIVEPDLAIFGEKDFQQLRVIEQLVGDLKLKVQILRSKLVRDANGLALSSRNARLSPDGVKHALSISQGLFAAQRAYLAGVTDSTKLENMVHEALQWIPNLEIDYISVVDEQTLERVAVITAPSRMLVVARIEGVRLLDNIEPE